MKKQRILVVDDEPDMRVFLSTLLETNGYEPIVASDASEGIRKVREEMPHLIIIDVLMPKVAGTLFYQQLKTDDTLKHIPVIILSAISKRTFLNSHDMLRSFMGRPVPQPEAFIEKPPEAEELLKWTSNLLPTQRESLESD